MKDFILSLAAREDLNSITEYLIENAPSNLSLKTIARLEDGIQTVANNPELGHKREDLAEETIRFWMVERYLVIYRPDTEPLEIIRIAHGSRDIATLLGEDS